MLRVTTIFTGPPGAPFYSTLYAGGDTEGEASAAHAAAASWWGGQNGNLTNLMSWAVQPEVEVVDLATGNVTATFTFPVVGLQGAELDEPLPWTTQGLVRFRTGVFHNGRELRGRQFIPGLTTAVNADGHPTASFVSGYPAVVDSLIADMVPAGGLVVYSPTHHLEAQVSNGSLWTEWAILRSRRD